MPSEVVDQSTERRQLRHNRSRRVELVRRCSVRQRRRRGWVQPGLGLRQLLGGVGAGVSVRERGGRGHAILLRRQVQAGRNEHSVLFSGILSPERMRGHLVAGRLNSGGHNPQRLGSPLEDDHGALECPERQLSLPFLVLAREARSSILQHLRQLLRPDGGAAQGPGGGGDSRKSSAAATSRRACLGPLDSPRPSCRHAFIAHRTGTL